MSNWWDEFPDERFWIEIRYHDGIGQSLYTTLTRLNGHRDPWRALIEEVKRGDIVYHWHSTEHRFVGRSVVSERVHAVGDDVEAPLNRFTPILRDVNLSTIHEYDRQIRDVARQLEAAHPNVPLRLPFQFRKDGLRMMSNYMAKLPAELVELFFGHSGLSLESAESPDPSEGPDDPAPPAKTSIGYLQPFRPKMDTWYVTQHQGGPRRHGRKHETLVNQFADWLAERDHSVCRNAAIDLGLRTPATIIEAKFIPDPNTRGSWTAAVRQAVSQLYEYRYFGAGPKDAKLIFLASSPVPDDWIEYLEKDRKIGAAWKVHGTFELSQLAKVALRGS